MNERIEHCLYQAGLTAQGCWEDLDTYTQEGIEKFAELIVRECATLVDAAFDIDEHSGEVVSYADGGQLKEHFGVEE